MVGLRWVSNKRYGLNEVSQFQACFFDSDEIYADKCSTIGSIGVISMGFGLHEVIQKLGVEYRRQTAGQSKAFNDPFMPQKAEDVERQKRMLGQMHTIFKDFISTARGSKLK